MSRFVKVKSQKQMEKVIEEYNKQKQVLKNQLLAKQLTGDTNGLQDQLNREVEIAQLFPDIMHNQDIESGKKQGSYKKLNAPNNIVDIAQKRFAKKNFTERPLMNQLEKLEDAIPQRDAELQQTLEGINQTLASLADAIGKMGQQSKVSDDSEEVEYHDLDQEGSGIKPKKVTQKHNPYKVSADGTFGALQIDLDKLTGYLKLEAYKNGKRVLSRKVDGDLFDLITKRLNPKKKYSDISLAMFNKLVELAELPINRLSKKSSLIKIKPDPVDDLTGTGIQVKVFSSPEELMERIQHLAKVKKNKAIKNEMNEINDKLLELGAISKEEHKKILSQYII